MTDHLDSEAVSNLLDGLLTGAVEREALLHIAECRACALTTEQVRAAIALASELRVTHTPPARAWVGVSRKTWYRRQKDRSLGRLFPAILLMVLVASMITAIVTWRVATAAAISRARTQAAAAGISPTAETDALSGEYRRREEALIVRAVLSERLDGAASVAADSLAALEVMLSRLRMSGALASALPERVALYEQRLSLLRRLASLAPSR